MGRWVLTSPAMSVRSSNPAPLKDDACRFRTMKIQNLSDSRASFAMGKKRHVQVQNEEHSQLESRCSDRISKIHQSTPLERLGSHQPKLPTQGKLARLLFLINFIYKNTIFTTMSQLPTNRWFGLDLVVKGLFPIYPLQDPGVQIQIQTTHPTHQPKVT